MAQPTSYSWTLSVPALPGPSSLLSPSFTVGPASSPCVLRNLTRDDFLALIDRLYPSHYLDPLKNPGPGYEVIQTYARLFERVSLAIARAECSLFITQSHGASFTTVTVEFFRDTAVAGAFTLLQGTVIQTSKTGRQFVLESDVEFGASDLSKQVIATAITADHAYNVKGPLIVSAGTLPGEIDTVVLPLQEPPFTERGLFVRQVGEATGGQAGVLDELGRDRSIGRRTNESDDSYRARTRLLPDTVSIDAIRRQLDAIFLPLGLSYDLIETWEDRYQTYWDAPLTEFANSDYDGNLFVYDDPRDSIPFRNRWLSEQDHRAAIIVVIPDLGVIEDFGMAFDDPAVESSDHDTTLGRRAYSSFDIPVFTDLTVLLPGTYDGDDYDKNEFHLHLVDLLRKIKASGVSPYIELEGE